jgi:hypothetical protein
LFCERMWCSIALDESLWWFDRSGDSTVTRWDEVRRIDKPLTVTSLALIENMVTPNLHISDIIRYESDDSGNLRNLWIGDAKRYIRRNWEKRVRLHPDVLEAEQLEQCRVDLNSFTPVRSLGKGGFGTVMLITNCRREEFPVKICRCKPRSSIVFSWEFELICLLDRPCVVPCYEWSMVSLGLLETSAVLIMRYMSEGSLYGVLDKVKAGDAPKFWNRT